MVYPYHGHPGASDLNAIIWVDGDGNVSQWEDEGGATSNIYQSVNSDNDSTYTTTQIPVLNDTRTIRFTTENPSRAPNTSQTVEVRCKFEYVQNFDPLDNAPDAEIRLKEGTTTVRASTNVTVTQTATEHSLFLNSSQIGSVTDWDDVQIEIIFTTSGNGPDQEADYFLYRARVLFY